MKRMTLIFIIFISASFILNKNLLGLIHAEENTKKINCKAEYEKISKNYKPPEYCKTICQKADQYFEDLRAFVLSSELRTNCEDEVYKARRLILVNQGIYKKSQCSKTSCEGGKSGLAQSQRGTFPILTNSGRGSGFFIGRSKDKQFCIFATNSHVISNDLGNKEEEAWLDFNLDQKVGDEEKFLSQDICHSFDEDKLDLALIKVRCDSFFSDNLCPPKIINWDITPGLLPVPKACEGVLKSEGFPGGKFLRLNCTAKERCDGKSYCFQILGDSLGRGSSGGPIYNSKGELCGFNTKGRGKDSDSFKVTKSQGILDFAKENCPKEFQVS